MKNNNTIIILSLLLMSLSTAVSAYDMGIYQQNYKVDSEESILILEAGTEYKLKFKKISGNVDETTLGNKNLPEGIMEIKHDEHKTMGSSTIHVVEIDKNAPAFIGYIHLITYDGDGGDRVKHQDHLIRTIIVSGSDHSTRRKRACGEVDFGQSDRYLVEFKNRQQLDGANAKYIKDGHCD
jgi:hypothetical protein